MTDYRNYPDFLEGYAEAERSYAELTATDSDNVSRILSKLWSDANFAYISANRQKPAGWKGLGKIGHLLDLCGVNSDWIYRYYMAHALFRQGVGLTERGAPFLEEGLAALHRLQTNFRDLEDETWVAMYVLQAARHIANLDVTGVPAADAIRILEECIERFLDWTAPDDPSERNLVREQVARAVLELADLWQAHTDLGPEKIIALYRRLCTAYGDETEEDTPFLVTTALLETALRLNELSPADQEGAQAIYETIFARHAAGTADTEQAACALYRLGNLYVNQRPARVAEAQECYQRVVQTYGDSHDEAVLVWVGLARNNAATLLEILGSEDEATALFRATIAQFAESENEALLDVVEQARKSLAALETPAD